MTVMELLRVISTPNVALWERDKYGNIYCLAPTKEAVEREVLLVEIADEESIDITVK